MARNFSGTFTLVPLMRSSSLTAVAASGLALLLVTGALAAQAPVTLNRRLDSIFTAFSRTDTPGCAVGVDRDFMPLARRAYGMANLETPVPFSVGTISESGSTAKQFVAASIVMLALDGTLSLDNDITKWIPEAKGFGKRITIRHILSHTSGIPDRYTLHEAEGRPAGTTNHDNREVMDIVSRLRDLNFDPGEDYEYSNTGYVIAATLLERASGKSLQEFTSERIFKPLGMTSSAWRVNERTLVPGRAPAYAGNAQSGWVNDHPFTRVVGSGGLNITVDDYMKWSAALLRGDGRWGAIRDSMSAVIKLNDGTAITYGLGVSTDTWRGVKRISHTGSTGGYRAALYHYPDQKVSVGLLCNSGAANPGALATAVAIAVLGDALQPVTADATPAIALTPDALEALAGRFRAPRTEQVLILQVRGSNLVDSLSGAVYLPRGAGRFRARGGAAELEFSSGAKPAMAAGGASGARVPPEGPGAPGHVRYSVPNARAVEYERVAAPDTGAASRAALAGEYRSPELGAILRFTVRDGVLTLDQGWRGSTRLAPLYRDGFALPDGEILRFTRDARGRVTGMVLWAGRVRHLRFDRLAAGSR